MAKHITRFTTYEALLEALKRDKVEHPERVLIAAGYDGKIDETKGTEDGNNK